MRVLVCGSRDWSDRGLVFRTLDSLELVIDVVIEGCATGADSLAEHWVGLHNLSEPHHITNLHFAAKWDVYGKGAGPIRNQLMLDEGRPDFVVAFHDDIANARGTGDMVKRAKKAGVPVTIVSHTGVVRGL